MLRSGGDLAILAVGSTVGSALEAAGMLGSMGIEAAVANMRFVKPLDIELITRLAQDMPRLLTVEENTLSGGFGSAVTLQVRQSQLNVRTFALGIPDEFVEHGPQDVLRAKYGLDGPGITRVALSAFPDLALLRSAPALT